MDSNTDFTNIGVQILITATMNSIKKILRGQTKRGWSKIIYEIAKN